MCVQTKQVVIIIIHFRSGGQDADERDEDEAGVRDGQGTVRQPARQNQRLTEKVRLRHCNR